MSMLGFFRKRQKMIFVIMVILMVSFLVGYQGLQQFFRSDPAEEPLGESRYGTITLGMQNHARNDLAILRYLSLSALPREYGEFLYVMLNREDATRNLDYALLQAEADAMDVEVTAGEVDALVDSLRERMNFDEMATMLRQNQNITRQQLHGVYGRFLKVLKASRAGTVSLPPSERVLKKFFRDTSEQLAVQAVKLQAEDYLEDIPEPDEETIEELFEEYRDKFPGQFRGMDKFSFGYLLPDRVQVAWLLLDARAIAAAVHPTEEEIDTYLDEHPDESEAEDTSAASELDRRQKAIRALRAEPAGVLMQQTLSEVNQRLNRMEEDQAGLSLYQQVVEGMTLPADSMLDRTIPSIYIKDVPLETALVRVAELASPQLRAIALPTGPQENGLVIDPQQKVSFVGHEVTVRKALQDIASQIADLPELQWGACRGFDDVLFTIGGVRSFPVSAGETGLDSFQKLADNPILGRSFSPEMRTVLLQEVMQVRAINPEGIYELGQTGPVMDVVGTVYQGKLLWQVTRAEPAKVPDEMTPEIREEVIRDAKLRQAFARAEETAKTMSTAEGMQQYIQEHSSQDDDQGESPAIETNLVSRLEIRLQQATQRPEFAPPRLPGFGFPNDMYTEYFLSEAFTELAPQDLSGEYPKESEHSAAVPMQSLGFVIVARRTDYRPAMLEDYRQRRSQLMQFYLQLEQGTTWQQWFESRSIRQRADFEPAFQAPVEDDLPGLDSAEENATVE